MTAASYGLKMRVRLLLGLRPRLPPTAAFLTCPTVAYFSPVSASFTRFEPAMAVSLRRHQRHGLR